MSFAGSSNISPMMQALNRQATQNARARIAERFAELHDLDEIPTFSVQLQKSLAAASAQLDMAVQGKLDALKRAVDLMDESAVKLSNFTQNMKRVDDRIAQTNTAIAGYDSLKRVHFIRDNLNRVITQVDFIANVTQQERRLRDLLETEPKRLREVFVESLKLDSLRIALMTEIRENERELRDFVEQYLKVVPFLAADVADRALSNISGFLDEAGRERDFHDLALDSPADLVTTFEVIQMHQEYYDRRKAQFIAKGSKSGKASSVSEYMSMFEVYNLQEKARACLRDRMSMKVELIFDAIKKDYAASKKSKIMAILDAGSELIKLFFDIFNDVVPCIPPEYDTVYLYFSVFDEQLRPQIEDLLDGVHAINVGEIINVVDWLNYYNSQMVRFELGEQSSCVRYEEVAQELMKEYLSRIKAQVMKWFGNIQKQELEIIEAGDRTLITTNPEDMFNIIHVQMDVAKENLPPECIKDVVIACAEVLKELQQQSYAALTKNWRDITPETMCSTINDNLRMQEKCQEFADTVLDLIPQEDHRESLTVLLEEVAGEYVSLAVSVVSYLARVVLEDLDEAVFSRLFSPEWEAGEQFVAIAIATVDDYLLDFSKWLSDYFYCKLVYELLCKFSALYVMSLRRFTPGSFKFGVEFRAAKTIIDDEELLVKFFEKYIDQIIQGGAGTGQAASSSSSSSLSTPYVSPVREELNSLRRLSMMVTATHISSIESEVRAMYRKWGADGHKLVVSVINSNPALSKGERADLLEAVTSMFTSGSYSTVLSDEFPNVADSHLNISSVAKAVKQKTRMFWAL